MKRKKTPSVVNEDQIIAAIRKLLTTTAAPISPPEVVEAPSMPTNGPRSGARVHYIAIPRRGKIDDSAMSPRLRQVWRAIQATKKVGLSSKGIEAKCKINRNAVSGAVFSLRQMGLIGTRDLIGE